MIKNNNITNATTPQLIHYELAHPRQISLKRLVGLTRDYYRMSAASVDNPHSQFHRWYYCLANECERRGLELERVLRT